MGVAALLVSGAACRKAPPERKLEVLVPFLPATLDPFADSRLVARSLFTAIYEPLVEETALGIRPAIAESWTNPSPNSWVFRIAATASFHDGTLVTSDDVLAAVRTSRAAVSTFVGLADLKEAEAPDARTVRFTTHTAARDFLLAVSALYIVRPAGGTFMGTGRYRVVARTPELITLRRHPRPNRPLPFFDEVRFRRMQGPLADLRLLREGRDLAVLEPTRAMVDEIRDDLRYQVMTTQSGGLTYLAIGFAAGPGPLGDVRVRRSLRLAIDLPELARAGTIAGGTPAGQLVPPGTFGFDPVRTAPHRDVVEARRLLAAAGLPNGFDAALDVNPHGRQAAEALARQAAEAGIRLHVTVHSPDEFVARIQGKSPLYLYSWYVGEDAGHSLRSAFHTKDPVRVLGTLNRTGFSNPAIDRIFVTLAATTRAEERQRLLREVLGLLDTELPWIPLFSARQVRILPAGLGLPQRADGLFVVTEARPAGRGR